MSSSVNNALQVPYDIACYIQSLLPPRVAGGLWAESRGYLEGGINPTLNQMKQGLILVVDKVDHKPRKIYTRFGEWTVLGSSSGNFAEIFKIVQEKLNLKQLHNDPKQRNSFWIIQTWNGQCLEEPVPANEGEGEFIPYQEAMNAFKAFQEDLKHQAV